MQVSCTKARAFMQVRSVKECLAVRQAALSHGCRQYTSFKPEQRGISPPQQFPEHGPVTLE
jgi:hypothetical protein